MSRATFCPQIIHNASHYKIIQNRTFSIKIAELFEPKDGSLQFYLKSSTLDWLHLDKNHGVLYGIGPKVPYNKRFKITLTASNEMGFVTKSFILVVMDTDVVETMPHTLENILSLRKRDYGYSHLALHSQPITDYLFIFYEQEAYRQRFEEALHDLAEKHGLELAHKKINAYDFSSLMNAINPNFEKECHQYLGDEVSIIMERLSNQQFRALARQGSQIPGSHAVPAHNYMGGVALMRYFPNWLPIANVLEAASKAVRMNKTYQAQHSVSHKTLFKYR